MRTPVIARRDVLRHAALLPTLAAAWPALAGSGGFTHSVASGEPRQDGATLWTRFVPSDGLDATLRVEVAEDERFAKVVARGQARCGPESDFCAHATPAGLKPGRWHWYRFIAPDGTVSPVGRTKTLPAGSPPKFRIAVFSCANATSGWFNAYAHAAARDDIDLVVHLGDYIYESRLDRSDALPGLAAARGIEPLGEAANLAAFRLRYASYRRDPALQALHQRFPMVTMWDDHETANNSWAGGARNHGPGEGPWEARAKAGVRAFREWLPAGPDHQSYRIGDLATLFRPETRLTARSRQLDLADVALGGGDLAARARAFVDGPLANPARTMMGAAQERWLADGMAASVSAGIRWQVLAQQVVMGATRFPAPTSAWFAAGAAPSGRDAAEASVTAALQGLGVPVALDRWDGYPAARRRLLDSAARARADLVVLSGDSHNAWAFELQRDGDATGVEFAGHSVSSLGIERRYGGDAVAIADAFVKENPALRWCDTSRRGYMVAELTPEAVRNSWLFLPSRNSRESMLLGSHELSVEKGARRFA